MRMVGIAAVAVIMAATAADAFEHLGERLGHDHLPAMSKRPGEIVVAQRRTCKAVKTCREAVELWCGGYSRADADGDGIPCENVCRSRAQVDAIKKEIGC